MIEFHPEQYEGHFCPWLTERHGEELGRQLWERTLRQFDVFLQEEPPYGGLKAEKSRSICGALLVFSMASVVPERLRAEDLEALTKRIFMDGFVKLGKLFDLNRPTDIRLLHWVFRLVGKQRQRAFQADPTGFCCHLAPFDRAHGATRYDFTQCPHAEFAKRHNLLHILPAMCNCDFFGIEQLHGKLIRRGTCGNSGRCDYCVVGSRSPMAREFETVRDEQGFLVSRQKESSVQIVLPVQQHFPANSGIIMAENETTPSKA